MGSARDSRALGKVGCHVGTPASLSHLLHSRLHAGLVHWLLGLGWMRSWLGKEGFDHGHSPCLLPFIILTFYFFFLKFSPCRQQDSRLCS